jgi:hypothetical protein
MDTDMRAPEHELIKLIFMSFGMVIVIFAVYVFEQPRRSRGLYLWDQTIRYVFLVVACVSLIIGIIEIGVLALS